MDQDDENDPLSLHVERPIYQQDELNKESLYAKPSHTSKYVTRFSKNSLQMFSKNRLPN